MEGRHEYDGMSGIQGHDVSHMGAFNHGPAWRGGGGGEGGRGGGGTLGILGSPPISKQSKPTGLMDIKLNEKVIQKFLSNQKRESEERDHGEQDRSFEVDPWSRGGDETPEVTPPVSPSSNLETAELPNIPKAQLKLYQRIQQKQKTTGGVTDSQEIQTQSANDDYYSEDEEDQHVLKNVLNNLETGNNSPLQNKPLQVNSLPPELSNMMSSINQNKPEISPLTEQQTLLSPTQNSPANRKGEKKDPRLHKVDPRKERQALKEEEDRLEREKDKRIMELDLGSVFGDLELPPLTVSPKRTEEEKYLSDKLGLPFKPHIYHVAKEIDASINSHSPIDWVLIPVEVKERDYSYVRHHFSPSQLELDPRLRRFAKSGAVNMKDLPLPTVSAPKSDPRLKGKADPRRQNSLENRRRSSEDSEGNHVYNPAKELNKERMSSLGKAPPQGYSQPMETQRSMDDSYHSDKGYGDDQYQGDQEHFNQGDDPYDQSQGDYYPQDQFNPNQDYHPMDYGESMGPMDPGMNYPGNQDLSYQQVQLSMGILKGIQQNMEAILHKEGMHNRTRGEFPGRDPRMRPGMNPSQGRGFPGQMPGMRGFPPLPNRGQWNPRFGRGDFRGRPELRSPGGNLNQVRTRDPRVK